jgi:ABC-2 type transport system permease protein
MLRYLRIWLAQMRYSLAREMQFKGNFILWIIVELCWFALQLAFIGVLYFNVKEIAGWSGWQMVLLVSTSHLVQQLFQAFVMINCMNLPELVQTGRLDFFLAQPVSTRFLVSTRAFEPGSIVNCLMAVIVCVYAACKIPVPFSPVNIALYVFLVVLGVVVHYSFMMFLMTMSFWMTRAQGFVHTYYNLFQLARLPREAFRGVVAVVFTWAIPMLLVANVPARTLIDGFGWKEAGYLVAITVVTFIASGRFFEYGLKHYTSASS